MNPINKEEIDERRRNADLRQRIRRIFSENKEVRDDAIDALKDAWDYELPSFRMEELATMPTEACTIVAAGRDRVKELIDWLIKI